MRKRIFFILLLGCLLSGCAQAPLSSSVLTQRVSLQEELIAVVKDDLRQTKGWPEGDYSIKYLDRQGGFELFFVTNLPAADAFKQSVKARSDGTVVVRAGGDGKSYTAWVSSKTKRVERKTYIR